jgi:lysylphosphatidylglycerol synthetase-like protein (DUF2156 family)
MIVRDREGCRAFANLVTEFRRRDKLILMRRRQEVESGLMDFLFVSFFLWNGEAAMLRSIWV